MAFQTPQFRIGSLLDWARTGRVQLPDFQRDYKWDDERIRQLLVTILRGHPMGVVMLLETGNDQVRFKPKPLAGITDVAHAPEFLLLDGQQRMTSMVQALTGDGVVETVDDRKRRMQRRYFVDVELALGSAADQEAAVLSLAPDGRKLSNFDRKVDLDVSTPELQHAQGIMPVTDLLNGNATAWLLGYAQAVPEQRDQRMQVFTEFNIRIAAPITAYEIPAIQLDRSTSKEAVATVFEKVNTGGLPLDVFELLTATFAGDADYFAAHGTDFRLGDDWQLTQQVIDAHPSLRDTQRTDFLQAVTLLTTLHRRQADVAANKTRPSATSARREDVLRLSLTDYLRWAEPVREALHWVAHFLTSQHIHTADFVPYRTQVVPLAVFRALLGPAIDTHAVKRRIAQWYWCGVLGELYGSTTETRFARDAEQVPDWARAAVTGSDARIPDTVSVATFRETRLLSLRTRNAAAYKGLYALVMAKGCRDWRLDQPIEHSTYLDMQVDIHHVFPRAWCLKNDIDPEYRESIVNKTPLAKATNIFLGGASPSVYLPRLEKSAGLDTADMDEVLREHLIDPDHLRAADFDAFFEARWQAMLELVEHAMGKAPLRDWDDVYGQAEVKGFEPEPDDPEDGDLADDDDAVVEVG